MVDYAPGMRTIIRDEEWMVKKIEKNNLGNLALNCIGISPLVKDKEVIFLTDLEDIKVVKPGRGTSHPGYFLPFPEDAAVSGKPVAAADSDRHGSAYRR